MQCFNCAKLGHLSRNCPEPRKPPRYGKGGATSSSWSPGNATYGDQPKASAVLHVMAQSANRFGALLATAEEFKESPSIESIVEPRIHRQACDGKRGHQANTRQTHLSRQASDPKGGRSYNGCGNAVGRRLRLGLGHHGVRSM